MCGCLCENGIWGRGRVGSIKIEVISIYETEREHLGRGCSQRRERAVKLSLGSRRRAVWERGRSQPRRLRRSRQPGGRKTELVSGISRLSVNTEVKRTKYFTEQGEADSVERSSIVDRLFGED